MFRRAAAEPTSKGALRITFNSIVCLYVGIFTLGFVTSDKSTQLLITDSNSPNVKSSSYSIVALEPSQSISKLLIANIYHNIIGLINLSTLLLIGYSCILWLLILLSKQCFQILVHLVQFLQCLNCLVLNLYL